MCGIGGAGGSRSRCLTGALQLRSAGPLIAVLLAAGHFLSLTALGSIVVGLAGVIAFRSRFACPSAAVLLATGNRRRRFAAGIRSQRGARFALVVDLGKEFETASIFAVACFSLFQEEAHAGAACGAAADVLLGWLVALRFAGAAVFERRTFLTLRALFCFLHRDAGPDGIAIGILLGGTLERAAADRVLLIALRQFIRGAFFCRGLTKRDGIRGTHTVTRFGHRAGPRSALRFPRAAGNFFLINIFASLHLFCP